MADDDDLWVGARLLVYAGGECELLGAGGGIALVTALVVGGSRGG